MSPQDPSMKVNCNFRFLFAAALALFVSLSSFAQTSQQKRSGELDAREVFAAVRESIVTIEATAANGTRLQGSGVAYRNGSNMQTLQPSSTWIATNAHVVADAVNVVVRLGTERHTAKVEYVDKDLDLALVLAPDVVIKAAWIASQKSALVPGERVYAIGAPLGLEHTITEGIFSARRENKGVSLLQTSAAISSGNSGGGLFNSRARLIGITTFKLKGGENLSFSVDASYIETAADALTASKMLRLAAQTLGSFSAEQLVKLNGSGLTRWLTQGGPDGGLQYVSTLNTVLPKSPDEARAHVGKVLSIAETFVGARQIATTHGAQDQTVVLVCQLKGFDGRPLPDGTLTINYQNSTVNGKPATISESEIRLGNDTRINRHTGGISMTNERLETLASGTCAKAAERKF